MYNGGRGFIYLPPFAFFSSFINFLGLRLASLFWNILQSSVYIWALYKFSSVFALERKTSLFFFYITICTIPLSFSCFRNGQANILIFAITIWTCIAILKNNWNLCTLLLVLGLCIKPIFIVFFLLIAGIYTFLWKRLIFGVFLAFTIPMIFTPASYVLNQYKGIIKTLKLAIDIGINKSEWANIFNILPQLTGKYISYHIQIITMIIASFLVLILCLKVKFKTTDKPLIMVIFILSFCYLLLFNPRTEPNSYIFIGPIYGYLLAYTLCKKAYILSAFIFLFFMTTELFSFISLLFSSSSSWVAPLVTTIFLISFIFYILKNKIPFKELIS